LKLSIDKHALITALGAASKAVSTKDIATPILEGVLLEASGRELKITGNNLETAIQTTAEADVRVPGSIVVNAKMLMDIAKSMPDEEIDITVIDRRMNIEAGKTKMEIMALDGKGFPAIPNVNCENPLEMDAKTFKDMIDGVSFATIGDDLKPTVECILLDVKDGELNAVALDGFTMAIRRCSVNAPDMKIIIRAKDSEGKDLISGAISCFTSGDVQISQDDHVILVKNENTKALLRTVGVEYLNYRNLVKNDFETDVRVRTKDLLGSAERCKLLLRESGTSSKKCPIRLTAEKRSLHIFLNCIAGTVNDEIPIDMVGKGIEIHMDPTRLSDCLRRIDDNEAIIKFVSEVTPCLITPVDGNKFLYLVAPVRK
jgi:DNA polymerase-3 subunit beta